MLTQSLFHVTYFSNGYKEHQYIVAPNMKAAMDHFEHDEYNEVVECVRVAVSVAIHSVIVGHAVKWHNMHNMELTNGS